MCIPRHHRVAPSGDQRCGGMMIFACSRTGVCRARRRPSIDCHGSIQIVSPLGARHNSLSHCRLLWHHELAELAPIMIALARHHQEILSTGINSICSISATSARSRRARCSRYAAWTSTLRLRRCTRDFRAVRDPDAPDWCRASWAAGAVRRSRRLADGAAANSATLSFRETERDLIECALVSTGGN